MLRELHRIYHRYIALHSRWNFANVALDDGHGNLGYVEECSFSRDWVRLRGWTLLHQVRVEIDGAHHPLARRVLRGDVVLAKGAELVATGNQHGRVGFELTFPRSGGPVRLVAEDEGHRGFWEMPLPDKRIIQKEIRRLRRNFLLVLVSASPVGLRYLLGGRQRAERDRVRKLMGFHTEVAPSLLLDRGVLLVGALQRLTSVETTIIVPVYNAFDLLVDALDRVERHTDVRWRLVLVEDASPDPRVRPWLTRWAAERADRVTLLLNQGNLGFVQSVNRGLVVAAEHGGPVILLNSDALVPEAWASRLLRPLLEDESVASVTPMSNDATIMGVPWNVGRVQLKPGVADKIDAAARALSPDARATLPTGVGFCMAMSPQALKIVPQLDLVFGKGYGEEVDWCRKTTAAGMSHLGIGNLFVEHRGGESFGTASKISALDRSAKIINSRYPEFVDEVHRFIESDPLLTARLVLAMRWAAESVPDPVHVYLGHSLGGGAENWLAARIVERARDGRPTIVIRIGGKRRFRVELHADNGLLSGETDDIELVGALLTTLPYHSSRRQKPLALQLLNDFLEAQPCDRPLTRRMLRIVCDETGFVALAGDPQIQKLLGGGACTDQMDHHVRFWISEWAVPA